MAKKEVPIYLVCGFLESGKTTFISETICDENFSTGEKTLVLVCEEGGRRIRSFRHGKI